MPILDVRDHHTFLCFFFRCLSGADIGNHDTPVLPTIWYFLCHLVFSLSFGIFSVILYFLRNLIFWWSFLWHSEANFSASLLEVNCAFIQYYWSFPSCFIIFWLGCMAAWYALNYCPVKLYSFYSIESVPTLITLIHIFWLCCINAWHTHFILCQLSFIDIVDISTLVRFDFC